MSKSFVNLDYLKKEKSNPFWFFRIINSTRPQGHSANKIYKNNKGKTVVVRCNCGKKTYHPVIDGKINWDIKIKPTHLQFYLNLEEEKTKIIFED